MQIRFSKAKVINAVMYINFLLVYLITLVIYNMGHPVSRIRYYFLALVIIVRVYNNIYQNIV